MVASVRVHGRDAAVGHDPCGLLPSHCPEPVRRPVMVQRWDDVVFLHWRYDPAVVQRLLPHGVTVDEYDGCAWVGLIPFSMEGLGVPGMAPLPLVGSFPEVNVRTYVRAGHRRGVWFFSLDVDRRLPAVVARSAYRLPYFAGAAVHGRTGDLVRTRVERRWPSVSGFAGTGTPARSAITVRTGGPIDAEAPLPRFLTARWGLITSSRQDPDRPGRLRYAPVDHPVWPLHAAEVVDLDDGLVVAAGLPHPGSDPHAMWSPGVDVRVGRPRRI
jgi:uncharacterized protein